MNYNQNFLSTVKIIVLAAVLAVGVSYVSAQSWTAPTQTPPNGNTAAPVNVSSTAQTKLGALIVNGGTVPAATGLSVPSGKVGIGLGASVPSTQLHVSNSVSGPEVARFQAGVADASYINVHSSVGDNLLGINAGGGWVGPVQNVPLSFKVADAIVAKFTTDGNLEFQGDNTLKIPTGAGANKVLISDVNGVATWGNPTVGSTQVVNDSVVTGASNSDFDDFQTFPNGDGGPGAHPDWYKWTADCPPAKPMLISCSGGVKRETGLQDNTGDTIVPTIIVPDTTAGRCSMYSEYEGGDNPVDEYAGAVRLYAICI